MSAGFVEISDETAAYLWTVASEHTPGQCGWCRAGCCAEQRETLRQLAMCGQLGWDPLRDGPLAQWWTARPEPGRWP